MTTFSRREIFFVQFWGVALSFLLFTIHTVILFGIAYGLKELEQTGHKIHPGLTGPMLILGCFMALFATHMLEGAIWAMFLWRKRLMADFGEAIYFSLTSFSAVGYGDVVLRKPWRVLGAIMAVNGLLLFGCSTAFIFVVMQRTWIAME